MMFPTSITKEELNSLPLGHYEGQIVLAYDEDTIDRAMGEIAQYAIVGFDTESKPTFKKGQQRHLGLIQIATDKKVFLLRTHEVGMVDSIHRFLENENILKVGIGLSDDLHLLTKLRITQFEGFIDLNNLMPELGAESIGARNLSAMILEFRISKSAQTSNWEAKVLTPKQITYAATDAWICLEIYRKLKEWGYVTE